MYILCFTFYVCWRMGGWVAKTLSWCLLVLLDPLVDTLHTVMSSETVVWFMVLWIGVAFLESSVPSCHFSTYF